MSGPFQFTADDSGARRFLARFPTLLLEKLRMRANALVIRLVSHIVLNKMQGQVIRGGRITRTIRPVEAKIEGTVVTAGVLGGGPETTVTAKRTGRVADFAAVQEFGGISSYVILPVDKKALAFELHGARVVVRSVLHPPLRARAFMRGGLADMRPEIIAGFQAAVAEAAAEARA